jgi:hypothetical protein
MVVPVIRDDEARAFPCLLVPFDWIEVRVPDLTS